MDTEKMNRGVSRREFLAAGAGLGVSAALPGLVARNAAADPSRSRKQASRVRAVTGP